MKMPRNSILTMACVLIAWACYAQPTGSAIRVSPDIDPTVAGEPLNYLVNTPYRELGPMQTKDGKRLYFSRQGFPYNVGGTEDEDIWYSEFDDEKQAWSKAINIGPPLNNTGPNFVTGIGRTGDTLLLGNEYLKNGKMRAGVSVSVKVGTLWSFPQPIKIEGDYNFAGRSSYDISYDRNTMIIAQEKADSHGKLDLYVTFRDPNAKRQYAGIESVNLGDVVNSFGNETTPWLAYDGRTLYFASDGHNGYGGLDIFVTKRLDDTWTNWSEPFNLGAGINSPYDDMSFNYNPLSRFAYYARGLTPENTDIYRVDMTYLFLDKDTPISSLVGNEVPLQIGETEVVADVFNDDSDAIRPESQEDLDYVVEFMQQFPDMIIQVSTHSNLHESREQSQELSRKRASRIVDYFVAKGISRHRLPTAPLGHDVVKNLKPTSLHSVQNTASTVEFKYVNTRSVKP